MKKAIHVIMYPFAAFWLWTAILMAYSPPLAGTWLFSLFGLFGFKF